MRLCKYEIHKLITSPAILVFLSVCLVVNIATVFLTSYKEEIDYMNSTFEVTGTVYDDTYLDKFKTLPVPTDDEMNKQYLYNKLEICAESSSNVFEGWTSENLPINDDRFSPLTQKIQQWKYNLLQPRVTEMAINNEGNDVYFSGHSSFVHLSVFNMLGTLLMAETAIFFLLIMLWTLGYEQMMGTTSVTLATKKGRNIIHSKITAALIVGTIFFVLIFAITYGISFSVNDFSHVWNQSISAQYHVIGTPLYGMQPFITWNSMTIGQFFFAMVGVAYLNSLVVALFAIPFGLLIKNSYTAFVSVAGIVFLHFIYDRSVVPQIEDVPFVWLLSKMLPYTQIMNNDLWFSDGGSYMLLPHFETIYPLICIAIMIPVIVYCKKRYKHKEIL
ncbi:MAG: hypothetical protein LBL93_06775 [Ruminococcus sp.]|jgi:hypothetical protein|nr:hypothetical protein [Ruminococcus sp.]